MIDKDYKELILSLIDELSNVRKDKDYKELISSLLNDFSNVRIEWLKGLACGLARNTGYEWIYVKAVISLKERILLMHFWAEEIDIYRKESMRKQEEEKKKIEDFIREKDKLIPSLKIDQASSSIEYLFPIGKA